MKFALFRSYLVVNPNCMYKSWEGVLHLTYFLHVISHFFSMICLFYGPSNETRVSQPFLNSKHCRSEKQNFYFYTLLDIVTSLTPWFITFVNWIYLYSLGEGNSMFQEWEKFLRLLLRQGILIQVQYFHEMYTVKKERVTYVEQGAKSYGRHGILKFV